MQHNGDDSLKSYGLIKSPRHFIIFLRFHISHICNIDVWKHVLKHGGHQLHVESLTTETVQHYEWCFLVQLLKHKLLLHCRNVSGRGVIVYLERDRRAMWNAGDFHVRSQLGTSEDAQVRHMEQPSN